MKDRFIKGIAGAFVVASVLLSIYVDQRFLWFTGFVGINLFQSSLTNWCLLGDILVKLGVKESNTTCSTK